MNIKITADSTCDLSEELVKKYDIEILPLYIVKDGKSYKDGVEITPSDIFEHVKAGGALTSTAAVNVADYIDAFTPLSKEYDAVIHVDISADFSSCYQNACIAAENFDNVYIDDELVTTLNADFTGGWGNYVECAELKSFDSAGEHTVKIVPKGLEGKASKFGVSALAIA